jgi:hypothetical protein
VTLHFQIPDYQVKIMHTLSVYYGVGVAQNTTDFALPAVPDQIIATVNNAYQFTATRKILKAAAFIPNGTVCRLSSPTYNRGFQPTVDPINPTATPPGSLPAVCDYMDRGPNIPKLENFQPLTTRTGAAVADVQVGLWSTPNFAVAPAGMCYTIRGTANCTGALGGWRLGQITFDQNLPYDTYKCVGLRVYGANCLFARLVFPGQYERPGCIANLDETAWCYPDFRFGRGGLFGVFGNIALPQLEVIGTGAVAAQNVYLDLIPQSLSLA